MSFHTLCPYNTGMAFFSYQLQGVLYKVGILAIYLSQIFHLWFNFRFCLKWYNSFLYIFIKHTHRTHSLVILSSEISCSKDVHSTYRTLIILERSLTLLSSESSPLHRPPPFSFVPLQISYIFLRINLTKSKVLPKHTNKSYTVLIKFVLYIFSTLNIVLLFLINDYCWNTKICQICFHIVLLPKIKLVFTSEIFLYRRYHLQSNTVSFPIYTHILLFWLSYKDVVFVEIHH